MVVMKYIVVFIIFLIFLNLFVFFFVKGLNVFSASSSIFDSLKENHPYLGNPLITTSLLIIVVITIIAIIFMKSGGGRA